MAKKKKAQKFGENDDTIELHGLIGDLRAAIISQEAMTDTVVKRLTAVEAEVFRPRPSGPIKRLLARLFRRRG